MDLRPRTATSHRDNDVAGDAGLVQSSLGRTEAKCQESGRFRHSVTLHVLAPFSEVVQLRNSFRSS